MVSYLIEKHEAGGPVRYWAALNGNPFSFDVNEGIRFQRKEDAHTLIENWYIGPPTTGEFEVCVVEHVFIEKIEAPLQKAEAPKMMVVGLKINNYEDRRSMLASLAVAGYHVWADELPRNSEYLKDSYIMIEVHERKI